MKLWFICKSASNNNPLTQTPIFAMRVSESSLSKFEDYLRTHDYKAYGEGYGWIWKSILTQIPIKYFEQNSNKS